MMTAGIVVVAVALMVSVVLVAGMLAVVAAAENTVVMNVEDAVVAVAGAAVFDEDVDIVDHHTEPTSLAYYSPDCTAWFDCIG